MPGSVIGTQMNLGFLGQYARNGDEVVRGDRVVETTDVSGIPFGSAVFANGNNTVSSTAEFTGGPILTVAIGNSGGTLYAVGDIATITQSGGSLGSVQVTAVTAGGVVSGIALLDGGRGYTSASNLPTVDNNLGTGLTVTITAGNTASMSNFVGIAVREVKTLEVFLPSFPQAGNNSQPNIGVYNQGQPCDTLKRGCIIVQFQSAAGTSAVSGGAVFLRTSTNATYPNAVVGGFESAADSGHTLALTNCQFFTGLIDANNAVEIELLSIANA